MCDYDNEIYIMIWVCRTICTSNTVCSKRSIDSMRGKPGKPHGNHEEPEAVQVVDPGLREIGVDRRGVAAAGQQGDGLRALTAKPRDVIRGLRHEVEGDTALDGGVADAHRHGDHQVAGELRRLGRQQVQIQWARRRLRTSEAQSQSRK